MDSHKTLHLNSEQSNKWSIISDKFHTDDEIQYFPHDLQFHKENNRYAIDDKRLVMEIYNEMIKACKNPKERKIVEKSLKALFHNNKLLS